MIALLLAACSGTSSTPADHATPDVEPVVQENIDSNGHASGKVMRPTPPLANIELDRRILQRCHKLVEFLRRTSELDFCFPDEPFVHRC